MSFILSKLKDMSLRSKVLSSKLYVSYELIMKLYCIPEIFNTNISHQFLNYKKTCVNSEHVNTNSKGDFCALKPSVIYNIFKRFLVYKKMRVKNIYYIKIVELRLLKLLYNLYWAFKVWKRANSNLNPSQQNFGHDHWERNASIFHVTSP